MRECCLLVVLGIALSATAGVETNDEGKPAPTRLAVDFTDGSRVLGVPSIKAISVHTAFGEPDVTLDLVHSLQMLEDGETATVSLANGDRLTGIPGPGKFSLTAMFGEISVSLPQVTGFRVLTTAAPGLVLWNRLDGTPSVVGPDLEFLNVDGFTTGKAGPGALMSGNNVDGIQVPMAMLEDMSAGTVEYWFKVLRKPPTVSHGNGPTYYLFRGPFSLQYNANDGGAHGKYAVSSCGYFVYTERFGNSKSTDVLGDVGRWHHHAVVWNREGIKGMKGAKLAFFIDGKSHGHYERMDTNFSGPCMQEKAAEHATIHRNRNGFGGKMVYDELRVWEHAITDFSDSLAGH